MFSLLPSIRAGETRFLEKVLQRGLAMRELSAVRLSIHPTNAWIVTKRKKDLSRFFTPYERSLR